MAQQGNYKSDSTLRILLVGNSGCYYYVEELYELLMENPPEGIESVEVYNLYYSGCSMSQHYNWWQKNESNYDLFKVDANGRVNLNNVYQKWSLEQALAWADWDYISLHGAMPVAVIRATPGIPSSLFIRVSLRNSVSWIVSFPVMDTAATSTGSMEGLIFST